MDRIAEIYPGWECVGILGAGSFGEVYKIRKVTDSDDMEYFSALKVIHIPHNREEIQQYLNEGYSRDSIRKLYNDKLNEIKSEIRIMARLRGESNIVSYEDHQVIPDESGIGGDVLIRMELLTPLPKSFSGSFMSEAEVIRLGMDICKALMLCEKNNIIHRDIKPQNIFLSKNGNYKLGDFGIAKTCEGTDFGTLSGSFPYIAPEIVLHRKYNASVDIYSLGTVMFWALNGRRCPFVPTQSDIPTTNEQNNAFSLRMSGKSIPRAMTGSKRLNRIIRKATAFRSSERYRSAAAMLRDLEDLGARIPFARRMEDPDTMTLTLDSVPEGLADHEATVKGSSLRGLFVGAPRFSVIACITAAVAALIVCAVLFLSGLHSGTPSPSAEPISVTDPGAVELQLDFRELQLIPGAEQRISPTAPERLAVEKLLWSSSEPEVASVSDTGLVTALSPGSARITATLGASVAVCTVTVLPEDPGTEDGGLSVTLNKKQLSLKEDASTTLTARIEPAERSGDPIRWYSSDSSVASVKNGRITAHSAGTAVITASVGGTDAYCVVTVSANEIRTSPDPKPTAESPVPVKPTEKPSEPSVSSVSLSKSALELTVGDTSVLSAVIRPSDAVDTAVTWKSSNSSVASVSGGVVTAIGSGTTDITASAGGKTAYCRVTVSQPKGSAPTGYTMSIDGGIVIKDVDFTLHVYPNEPDYTNIRIYAIAPTGETFTFDLGRSTTKGLNCYIAGRWKIYAVVTNEYGSYSGADHGKYCSFDVLSFM